MWSTTSAASRRAPSSGNDARALIPLLLLFVLAALPVPPAGADPGLHELRAARREALRSAVRAKAGAAAEFGLLVVPVDFADARFDAGFDPERDLAPRLAAEPAGALGHYFGVASQGRTALVVTLAPRISLDGDRSDYSDIGWQGNERSRRLAREALEGARARGVDFAAADRDGDGEVDGVLVLHAAPGLENDLAGLIVPQQFYLAEPVLDRGTLARSYAVAAARSSLGLWAHESAHLLGLEDRYDHALSGDGEAGPRGGLGRFSLMASGWRGTGEGADPALPDAYSRLAVGWAELGDAATVGTVLRPRMTDPGSSEYFLAEQRDPAGNAPYDAALPPDRLLVYHVDTRLAEGQASAPTWPRHLRVQLVEADGGSELARGENDGADSDLFPFANQTQRFADATIPDSRTWSGEATGVDLSVTAGSEGLTVTDAGRAVDADLRLTFTDGVGFRPVARLPEDPFTPATVAFTLWVEDPTWGQFADGAVVTGELARAPDGSWQTHAGAVLAWQAAGVPPPGASTRFGYEVAGGALASGELVHVWDAGWADLALDGDWPGAWRLDHPGGDTGTTWHRWLDAGDDLPAEPILACTGAAYTSAAAWPDLSYGNDAHVRLDTPLLGTAVRWLELRHSVHLELLHPGLAVDGVSLSWVQAGGTTVPATPVDGWSGSVDPRARHALSGRPTFAPGDTLAGDGVPVWRRDALPLPDPARHGPGPWRLRLEFASSPLYRDRGWLVRGLAAHLDETPASAFPIRLDAGGLHWSWDTSAGATSFTVQRSDDGGRSWRAVAVLEAAAGEGPEHVLPRDRLGLRPGVRSRLRVAAGAVQAVLSPAIIAAGPAEAALSLPRPNPCSTEASIRVDGAGDPRAELGLFDLRGRRVRAWRPGGDPTTVVWHGDDADGRRLAAGVYIFRLRAQGRTLTRKVTWLP